MMNRLPEFEIKVGKLIEDYNDLPRIEIVKTLRYFAEKLEQ